MERAQKRDSVRSETFYFRKSVVPDDDDEEDDEKQGAEPEGSHDHEYTEMTIDAIINGKVCHAFFSVSVPYPGMVSGRVPGVDTAGEDVCEQH